MTTAHAEPDVVETSNPAALALVADAQVDIQVSTARRYPRSVSAFMKKGQEMATLTTEIATSCIYAVPRDGKTIEGPSARFAEVMMHAWGNMRAEGKALGDDGQYVTSRGVAWDLETNTAIGYEVKRRITGRNGNTYSADMITVTGNAGASIALRNAILKAIPTPFWKPIYNACRSVVAGDAKTFASRRDGMLKEFGIMGVPEARLCAALGLNGKLDITLDHMATLAGFFTALKDGDTTIEEAFPETGGLGGAPQPAQRKSQQQPTPAAQTTGAPVDRGGDEARSREMPSAAAGTVGGPDAPVVTAPSATGVVVDIVPRAGGVILKLDTGFQAAAKDEAVIRAAQMAKDGEQRVELVVKPSSDPKKYAPVVTEIKLAEVAAS